MNQREFGQEAFSDEQFLAGGITLLLSGTIGFVGNIFVLIITYRILRYRRNIPTIFILFLSWTDLLTFPLIYPQSLLKYFVGVYVGDYVGCDYQGTVITLLYGISITLVLMMSVDRLLALHKPFCYERYITYDKEKVKVTAIGVGTAGLTMSLLPAFGVGRNVLHFPGTFCLFEWGAETVDGRALLYIYMTLLSIAMLTIVFCNLGVVILTWRLVRRVQGDSTLGDKESAAPKARPKSSSHVEMEMQFAKISCVAAIAFVGCWSLFLIRVTMIQAGYHFDALLDFTSIRLASLHSVLNPWFYPLLRRKYREGFWYLMTWVGHIVTCTLIAKPENTLDDIVGGTPRTKRSKNILQSEERRRSSQRFVSTSTLATEKSISTDSK
ncbi:prostaglandin E2 receptor EP4 subtype [Exaiptasia diaphana]|uniref:G-protein coupled receptors family 1 profile domain-containing protein n=1 Tax=Exaiptasia diaphana TaxID=2652724 RepID=A0A913XLG0_EXADI|nr:prostaglandin E2 receptor EP4 subtype [Exaiptasia diaphana]KXJ25646.1 Prostaglandin E2 receptor EP4 subtype [Exaiptasia diaphana]